MYLNNLNNYNNALLSDNSLIKLTVNVTDKEITIIPNLYVTYNNILRNVTKCLTWLKVLPVWQIESCIYCLTDENKWKNENYMNTLYEEIIKNEAILEKIEIIRKTSHSLMVDVNKYLKKYVKYISNKYVAFLIAFEIMKNNFLLVN